MMTESVRASEGGHKTDRGYAPLNYQEKETRRRISTTKT